MKTLKYIGSFTLLMALTGTSIPLNAQSVEIPSRGPISFSIYDKDSNGLISENEFKMIRTERMSQMSSAGRPMRGDASYPSFSAFDTDGNGDINPE